MYDSLNALFRPQRIAVMGPIVDEQSLARRLFKNIISSNYTGVAYPVCASGKSVNGVRCYRRLVDLPEAPDLGIIECEADELLEQVERCGEEGMEALLILTANLRLHPEREKIRQQVKDTAARFNMRLLGPSSYGIILPWLNINASLFEGKVLKGHIAFISQSRSICSALLNWAASENVGFSAFVSSGGMVDLHFPDLLDYFGSDPRTRSIMVYMESLDEARRFMSAARSFARRKPIIILKAGQSGEGAEIIATQTGNYSGENAHFAAAFHRAGIVKVETIEQLFDCAQALAMQPRPRGKRLAIVTNAGAPAVLATDFLLRNGGELAELSEETQAKLKEALPGNYFISNPIDVLSKSNAERYRKVANICMQAPEVDGVLLILTSQVNRDVRPIAEELCKMNTRTGKTLLASCVGELSRKEISTILEQGNIPTYCFPESAVYSFLKMYEYTRSLETLYETPSRAPDVFEPQRDKVREIIKEHIATENWKLTELESKAILAAYDIPVLRSRRAHSIEEALQAANDIGYPVVLKINARNIPHRTEVGGLVLSIKTDDALRLAYREIEQNIAERVPDAETDGFLVEKMMRQVYELRMDAVKSPVLGPIIRFGLGGIPSNLYRDDNYAIPPLNMALSLRLIEQTKIYRLLRGYRGALQVDIEALQFLLYKFSYLLMDFPELKRVDINPFGLDAKGGIVLDAAAELDPTTCLQPPRSYEHLIISPYPEQLVKTKQLRNGEEVVFRPIRPEDEDLQTQMIENLSEETKRKRFFSSSFVVTHEFLVRYLHIDYDREMAIAAIWTDPEGNEKMLGVVRLVADSDGESAEYAIVLDDAWQGQGLGGMLTDYILEIAAQWGWTRIYATLLRNNAGMRGLFESRGFKISAEDLDTLKAELIIETKPVVPEKQ